MPLHRAIWRGGGEAGDAARLAALTARLPLVRDAAGDEVKAQLRAQTEQAIALGIFGVPAYVVEGKLLWGFDALPMLRAFLEGNAWFGAAWDEAAKVPEGFRR